VRVLLLAVMIVVLASLLHFIYSRAFSHGDAKSNWRNSCAISMGSVTTRFLVSSYLTSV
jgi:hypothetical protein